VKLSLVLFLLSLPVFAQNDTAAVETTIRQQDASFWEAYNHCDVTKMSQFFWPDIEFYHDKGGLTVGLGTFVEQLQSGLCGKPNYRLRREAVPGTVNVYPLRKNGTTYGAVISGEHYFYINENGKPEYRDGVAKFFHVWLVKDGTWKMARAVSYEHRNAPYENTRKEIMVGPEVLERYVGKYVAPKTGPLTVARGENELVLTLGGNKKVVLHPESENVYFVADRDVTFEFVSGGTKVSKIVIRERGAIVEEAKPE